MPEVIENRPDGDIEFNGFALSRLAREMKKRAMEDDDFEKRLRKKRTCDTPSDFRRLKKKGVMPLKDVDYDDLMKNNPYKKIIDHNPYSMDLGAGVIEKYLNKKDDVKLGGKGGYREFKLIDEVGRHEDYMCKGEDILGHDFMNKYEKIENVYNLEDLIGGKGGLLGNFNKTDGKYYQGKKINMNPDAFFEAFMPKRKPEPLDPDYEPEFLDDSECTAEELEARTLLGVGDVPHYSVIMSSVNEMKKIACQLYDIDNDHIHTINVDESFKHHSSSVEKIDVTFSWGDDASFYVKDSWEGATKEALGMALANILWDADFKFLRSNDLGCKTLVTDAVEGGPMTKTDPFKILIQTRPEAYGEAMEEANSLGLGDRHQNNVFLTKDGVTNIDFGYLNDEPRGYNPVQEEFSSFGKVKILDQDKTLKGQRKKREVICKNLHGKRKLLETVIEQAKVMGAKHTNIDNTLDMYKRRWGHFYCEKVMADKLGIGELVRE